MAVDCPEVIRAFLLVETPSAWIDHALSNVPDLLLDHANCELKAASTALAIIYRYPDQSTLVQRMSRLAREELRHFEQVRKIMDGMSLPFKKLSASRYAGTLRDEMRPEEPARLQDVLITGALIEARSCERFAALAPHLPADLSRFYSGLLASEARHFEHYLAFAEDVAVGDSITPRVNELKDLEAHLITEPDPVFRFHSGVPVAAAQN